MDEILKQLGTNFPALSVILAILAVAWFLSSENRKTRKELEVEVQKAVNSKLGETLTLLQERASQVDRAVVKQESSLQEVEKRVVEFLKTVRENEEKVSALFEQTTQKLGQLQQSIPNVEEESADEIAFLIQSSQDNRVAAALCMKLLSHADASSYQLEIAGDRLRKLGRHSLALKLYTSACERDPDRISAKIERLCLSIERDPNSRKEALEEARKLLVQYPKFFGRISDSLIEIEDYQGLLDIATAFESRWMGDREIRLSALRNRAVALRALSRLDEAAEVFSQALEMSPDDENILRPYSLLVRQQNNRSEMIDVFMRLHKIDPTDVGYHFDIIDFFLKDRNFGEARTWVDRAKKVARDPKDVYRLSGLEEKLGLLMAISKEPDTHRNDQLTQ